MLRFVDVSFGERRGNVGRRGSGWEGLGMEGVGCTWCRNGETKVKILNLFRGGDSSRGFALVGLGVEMISGKKV